MVRPWGFSSKFTFYYYSISLSDSSGKMARRSHLSESEHRAVRGARESRRTRSHRSKITPTHSCVHSISALIVTAGEHRRISPLIFPCLLPRRVQIMMPTWPACHRRFRISLWKMYICGGCTPLPLLRWLRLISCCACLLATTGEGVELGERTRAPSCENPH